MRKDTISGQVFLYSNLLMSFLAVFLAPPEAQSAVVYEEKAFLPARDCYSVDVSPDESVIYAPTTFGSWDHGVTLYDAHTYTPIKALHPFPSVPKYILASADGIHLYATAYYGAAVVKVRVADGAVVKSISVGPWPVGMVFDSARRYLYVMVNCPYPGAVGSISIIDTSTDTVVGTIGPIVHAGTVLAISPDDQFLYALSFDYAGSEPQTLYKMTIADRSVQAVPGVRVGGISVSPDGQLLYVADRFAGSVRVFQTSSMTETTPIPIGDVHSFWVAPSGDHGLAVCLAPASSELLIRVVGLPGGEVLQTLSHALQLPDGLSTYPLVDPVFWSRTTGQLLIPIFREHGGVLILAPPEAPSAVVYEEKAFLPASWCTSADISPDGSTIYARAHFGDWNEGVRLYSGLTYQHVKDFQNLPNVPWTILASADGNYLYATYYYGGAVVKLDASTGSVVKSISVGPWPGYMVFDSARRYLYVGVNCPGTGAVGSISVIDTSTDTVAGNVALNGEPNFCLVLSPDDAFLYVGTHNRSPETLFKIRVSDCSIVKTLAMPGIVNPALSGSPDGNYLYVSDDSAGVVRIIEAGSVTQSGTYSIPHVQNFSVAPSGDVALAVSYASGSSEVSLHVFDMSSASIIQTIQHTLTGGLENAHAGLCPIVWDGASGAAYIPVRAENGGVIVLSPVEEAWQVVYQTDFSTDPQWTTDQASNYYWNQAAGTYHAKVENNAPAYSPNRYFYKAVTWTGDSFEIQCDIRMTRADWSAGVSFGLFDENMAFAGWGGGQGVCLEFANPDAGRLLWLYIYGGGGLASASSPGGTYAVNTSYTCKLSYDAASGRIYAELRARDSGSLVWSKALGVPGGFTQPLTKLGGSRSGFGETGYGGVNRWAVSEAEIDNVVFKRAGVAPQPPVVTQFAINGGAETTETRTVTLNNTTENNATHYMASEDAKFTGATWEAYSTAPEFTLISGNAEKTVYFKTKNAVGESNVVSDSITLEEKGWQVVYQTDFSSDPGWITDQPSNYYWDQTAGTYHAKVENNAPAYRPNRYFYTPVTWTGGSFDLQVEVKMTRIDWSAGLCFGMFDENLSLLTGSQAMYLLLGNVDRGHVLSLYVLGATGPALETTPGGAYGSSAWYTCKISYNADAGTVSLRVANRDSGSEVWSATCSIPGGFTRPLTRLGGSRCGVGEAGYGGIDRWAVAEAEIDNVVLKQAGAAPQAPLVTKFAINDGAESTETRTVTLNNTTENSPTGYMASENSDFIGATWQTYSAAPQFTLTEGDGDKTVYFKAKNAVGESNVVSDTATLGGGAWEVIYQTDFSTDPGWTTNSPQNFYWKQADGTYYFKRTNGAEQYSYKGIPFDPSASYQLEFDVYMTRCDWAGGLFLGLGDSDMSVQTATAWLVSYHKVDQGQTAALIFYDSDGNYSHPGGLQPAPFELNTWYHNVVIYDRAAGTLSLRVRKVSDGSPVGQVDLGGVGSFAGVDRLYISSVGHVYASGATGEGYIDNLILKKYSPAPGWQTVYQTDFSTDPQWVTDQAANYYWNQAAGTYHAKVENNAPGHRPNRYFYKSVTWTGDSLELEWDVKITRMDWSGGVCFGLFDEDLALGGFEGGLGVQLVFGHPDEGLVVAFYATGATGLAQVDSKAGPRYSTNAWYTCKISSDAAAGEVSVEVKDRSSGSSLWSKSLSVPGRFTRPLVRLGGSWSGFGETGGGYSGVDRWAIAEAEIDNVVFRRAGVGPLPPVVTQFAINNGAQSTERRTVTLNSATENNPTHCIASENAGFSGATWQTYSAAPQFILSAGDGQKTVYFKTKNEVGESNVVSDAIQLTTSVPPGPEITTTSLPDGVEGEPYSQALQVSGGVPPYTWSIVTGKLPDGLSLDPNAGIISGTPTSAAIGTSTFTVRVTDSQSVGDTIYVFGGTPDGSGSLSSVEKYDPAADVWTFVSPMNEPRVNMGFCTDEQGRLYAIAGQSENVLRTVERYDPARNVWEYLAPFPIAVGGPAAFTLNGEVYAVGGWMPGYTNRCFIYSPDSDTWREGPSVYETFGHAGPVVSLSGVPYLIGGHLDHPWSIRSAVSMLVREGADLVWKPSTPLQRPRQGVGVTLGLDGLIYAIGGDQVPGSSGHLPTETVERFSEATRAWEYVQPMPAKRAFAGAVTDSSGRIWVVGGTESTSPFYDSVLRYDPGTDSWTTATSHLNTGRFAHGIAIVRGEGQTDEKELSITILPQGPWQTVYSTDLSSDPKWTTNDPANLSWDSATETFHGWQANTNTSYAYAQFDMESGASFRLQFDVRINSVQWSAGVIFGLFDPRLTSGAGAVVEYGLFDVGYTTALYAGNPSGPPAWEVSNWETGVWYRNVIEYDAISKVIRFEARERDTGELLSELSLSGIREFPPGMSLLGVSRLDMEGFNNMAVDFNLDNIVLKQYYEPPKRPFEILPLAGPLLRITWDSENGKEYQLWATTDLSSAEWMPVGPRMGGTGAKLYVDDYVEGAPLRFYRLEIISPSGSGAEYGVVVSESTAATEGWDEVVTAVVTRHRAQLIPYSGAPFPASVREDLAAMHPRHVCFVAQPGEVTDEFVRNAHELTRQLDDDPFGDCLWGIITGARPEDAARLASAPSEIQIEKGLLKAAGYYLEWLPGGVFHSEGDSSTTWVKEIGGVIDNRTDGPLDDTEPLAEELNRGLYQLFVTSGHASEYNWQLHWPDPDGEGFFYADNGQLYAIDHNGTRFDINNPNPIVYWAPGNCLIGRIAGSQSIALGWLGSGGALQLCGYVVPTWYGYMGWGMSDYFLKLQGRFSFAESFFLTNQALIFDQLKSTPGTDPAGLEYDKNAVVLYGDPAVRAVVSPCRTPLYDQSIEATPMPSPGQFRVVLTITMREDAEVARPVIAFLPFRIVPSETHLEQSQAKAVQITDDMVLAQIWTQGDAPLPAGHQTSVTFTCVRAS